jgi:hypothetical protein
MEWLIVPAFFAMVAIAILAILNKKRGGTDEFVYEKNEPFFSPAERSFFGILDQAVKDQAVVLGKVRVADVLRPPKGVGRSNWQKAFNRISSKHFDYLICAPDTLSVMAAIELDDKSHSRGKRAERDHFLEKACSGAGLPLHRFKAASTYSIQEVRGILFPSQEEAGEEPAQPETVKSEGVSEQICPKCSSPLVNKVAKKGEHKGAKFLACSAFPKCRYIVKIDA